MNFGTLTVYRFPDGSYRDSDGHFGQTLEELASAVQHTAKLRSTTSREWKRRGPMHSTVTQREAAALYAAAREMMGVTE